MRTFNTTMRLLAPILGLVHLSPAIDAVPEPGLIIYGQVFSQSAPTQTVAISGIAWNNAPGGTGIAPTTSTYPAPPAPLATDLTFYVARVPFESPTPAGLTLTGSGLFDLLSSASDAHQVGFLVTPLSGGPAKVARIKAVNLVANPGPPGSLPTFYNWADITTAKRGGTVRLDLIIDSAPTDPFIAWISGFLPAGDPRAARTADADGDGMTNEQEFLAGTHPLDGSSFLLAWFTPAPATNDITISWRSVTGKRYQLERNDSLASAVTGWIAEGTAYDATGSSSERTVSLPAGGTRWFYRVRVVP